MAFRPQDLDEIRHRLPIEAVVGETVPLRRAGTRMVGLCPFHSEKTPSFSVSSERGLFYCFGCQAGGDVFDFIMKRDGLTFPEAVQALADRAGVEIEDKSTADPGRDAAFRALESACQMYESYLAGGEGADARTYLKGRGLDGATCRVFRMGVAPPGGGVLKQLAGAGFTPKQLTQAGLVYPGAGGRLIERFRDRIMFPVRDGRGRVIGFGGRLYKKEAAGPKYLNSPETPLFSKSGVLYDLSVAQKAVRSERRLLLVEGYMDVVSLYRAGFPTALASLGTSLTERQVRLMARQQAEVYVAYDADAAGQRATERGLWLLVQAGIVARVVSLPEGEDPDSFVKKGGDLEAAIGQATPLVAFLTERAIARHGLTTPQGKGRVAREVLPGIMRMPGEVERDEELRWLAGRLGVREESLRAEANRTLEKRSKTGQSGIKWDKTRKNVPRADLRERIETDILIVLARGDTPPEEVGSLVFSTPEHQQVLEALKNGADMHQLPPEALNLWAKVSNDAGEKPPLGELVRAWLREGMKRREHELIKEIDQRERNQESVPKELITQLLQIQGEIRGMSG